MSKFKEIWADSQESEGNTMSKAEELAEAVEGVITISPHQRELIAKTAAELRRLAALEHAAEPVRAVPSDSVVVARKLVEDCLDGMKYSVQWERDGDGRPPSQICCFAIQDLESLLSAAPQPTHPAPRKPMTDAEKNGFWLNESFDSCSHEDCYLRGIATAERFHQIKE